MKCDCKIFYVSDVISNVFVANKLLSKQIKTCFETQYEKQFSINKKTMNSLNQVNFGIFGKMILNNIIS